MAREEVILTISPDGKAARVEVEGVKGKGCTKLTEDLEKDLGLDPEKRHYKKAYNERPKVDRKVGAGN